MKSPEEVKRDLYDKWMRRAEEDLAVAGQLLSDGVPYFGSIGFHAQQAAEKFLKAFLVWHQIEFPKTHDLSQLLKLVALREKSLSAALQGILVLTDSSKRH
jgi:HEPN domain-containing protein